MTTDEVVAAITAAKEMGMVAFVCVIPVSPELLRDSPEIALDRVPVMAADALAGSIQGYFNEEGIES